MMEASQVGGTRDPSGLPLPLSSTCPQSLAR
jgi:hypothetical protein